MGWETRRGQRVYYRKMRQGARVRSIYCGMGERGEAAAREDAERRRAHDEKASDVEREKVVQEIAESNVEQAPVVLPQQCVLQTSPPVAHTGPEPQNPPLSNEFQRREEETRRLEEWRRKRAMRL
ncbi:MAG: hypothetical protein WCD76_17910 [Pyrinomonadaceae bacterium]